MQNNRGLFSPLSIILMGGMLLSVGAYTVINYFAPDLLAKSYDTMVQIENEAQTVEPSETGSWLRVPAAGIDAPVSIKLSDSSIWQKSTSTDIVLVAKRRSVGLTPAQTLKMSPLYGLNRTKTGDTIYFDEDGVRTAYEIQSIVTDKPVTELSGDMVIYSYDQSDANVAAVAVQARMLGTIDWSTGQAYVIAD